MRLTQHGAFKYVDETYDRNARLLSKSPCKILGFGVRVDGNPTCALFVRPLTEFRDGTYYRRTSTVKDERWLAPA